MSLHWGVVKLADFKTTNGMREGLFNIIVKLLSFFLNYFFYTGFPVPGTYWLLFSTVAYILIFTYLIEKK